MRNILVTAAALLLLTGCTTTASNKDLLAKSKAMTESTHALTPKKLAAPVSVTAPTSIPTAPMTWKDTAGTAYTLTSTLSYIPAPPVAPPTPAVAPNVPTITTGASTVASGNVAPLAWAWQYDPGTPGSATGTSTYPVAGMNGSNTARSFSMTYKQEYSGELFHVTFGHSAVQTHFIYDAYLNFPDTSQLKNVEMDMNQVVSNGNTVILAAQCSGVSNTWEYTLGNSSGGTSWHASNVPCTPSKWTANAWHHIQIATHHDASGNVTYDWVGVDGYYSNFASTATGPSSYALKWAAGTLLINFQIDGANAAGGSISNILMDNTNVYYW